MSQGTKISRNLLNNLIFDLKNYYSAYNPGKNQNIYELLEMFLNTTDRYDCSGDSENVKKLKEFCKKYSSDKVAEGMTALKL